MSNITAKFIGKEYSIPEDVLTYLDLLAFTDRVQKSLVTAFVCKIRNKIQAGDIGLLDDEDLTPELEQQVSKFIAKLCDNGVFTRTVRDYLNNKGFQHISDVNNAALETMKSLLRQRMNSFQEGHENALQRAEDHVTGMGFSIWSGSLVNHAIYAAMEASTISKQEKEASARYQKEIDELCSKLESVFDKQTSQYINNEYIPNMESALTVFAYELLDTYVADLIANGKFDNKTLGFVDVGRSNDLLKNLDLSNNKQIILENAFAACPYNSAVYMQAMKYDLLDYESFQTAKLFKCGSIIISFLEENLGGTPQKRLNFISAELLSLFSGRSLRKITSHVADFIVDGYAQTIATFTNPAPCYTIMNNVDEEDILAGSRISKQKSDWLVDPIAPSGLWEKLTLEYGHTDLFDRLLCLLPDGLEISSKTEYDAFIKENLFGIFETIRQERAVTILEQRQEEARRKEEEAAAAKRTAERNKKIKKACLVASIVIIAVVIVSKIITKANNAKAYQEMAGEFCVYRVINDDGKEIDDFNWWLSIGEDGSMKLTSHSYVSDSVVDAFSGTVKNKVDFREFENYRIEDYRADASKYETAAHCYEFHIADKWDEFNGYIVCWQYENGKTIDVYRHNTRYCFVETESNYSFYKWKNELDRDRVSQNVLEILGKTTRRSSADTKKNATESVDVKSKILIDFATGLLGRKVDSGQNMELSDEESELLTKEVELFGMTGRFQGVMSGEGRANSIMDMLDWTTSNTGHSIETVINILIDMYGSNYGVDENFVALPGTSINEVYAWLDVDGYEGVLCWENPDGTITIRWSL